MEVSNSQLNFTQGLRANTRFIQLVHGQIRVARLHKMAAINMSKETFASKLTPEPTSRGFWLLRKTEQDMNRG